VMATARRDAEFRKASEATAVFGESSAPPIRPIRIIVADEM